jgi:hypothetical protein
MSVRESKHSPRLLSKSGVRPGCVVMTCADVSRRLCGSTRYEKGDSPQDALPASLQMEANGICSAWIWLPKATGRKSAGCLPTLLPCADSRGVFSRNHLKVVRSWGAQIEFQVLAVRLHGEICLLGHIRKLLVAGFTNPFSGSSPYSQ